jgi:branched-chain amino acid transport system substrate-binding protein
VATANPLDQEIPIGVFASLSGSDQSYGFSTWIGFSTAFDEKNTAGGVLGKNLRLIPEDDKGKREGAKTAAEKLIHRDHVVALLGEFKSRLSSAAAEVAQANNVPMISHGATNPEVTKIGRYIFRICFTDVFQGQILARFARLNDRTKFRRVVVLHETDPYSKDLAFSFKTEFERLKGEIVERGYQGAEDTLDALDMIKEERPDAVFVPLYYEQVAGIVQSARAQGLEVPFFGADGWDSAELLEMAGTQLEGSYYSSHYSAADPYSEDTEFLNSFRTRNRKTPDAVAALAYDAAQVLIGAIERAGSLDRDRIRDAIATTKDVPGVTGKITLDPETRNASKPIVILQVKDGKSVFVEKRAQE